MAAAAKTDVDKWLALISQYDKEANGTHLLTR